MTAVRRGITIGTAGHVDHGKTSLVEALTGVDTDRLPEERARGLSIALGFAPLTLRSGVAVSVVDVPGHERFVRTMVAGATGIDAFMLVVAADDGVMPQTVEHLAVLRALDVRRGIVVITKTDRADPDRATRQVRELLPSTRVVPCSVRAGRGVEAVRDALDGLVAETRPARDADRERGAVMHLDRVFTVAGVGVVVTGTLRGGPLSRAETVTLLPAGRPVRIRGLQVHDRTVETAAPGQRVAVNLGGVRLRDVARGDALAGAGAHLRASSILDCRLEAPTARHNQRVQVHHGTRSVAGRLSRLDDELWQVRLERTLIADEADRIVLRAITPPGTLGGGTILDVAARRHGPSGPAVDALRHRRAGTSAPLEEPPPVAPTDDSDAEAAAVLARIHTEGAHLLHARDLGTDASVLRQLLREGRAVNIAPGRWAAAPTAAEVRASVLAIIDQDGAADLAGVRDHLGVSRRTAEAWLAYLDHMHATRRLPDHRRVRSRVAPTSVQRA